MEIEATVIVKKILHVDGPKDAETAIKLMRSMMENNSLSINTFQKWKPGDMRANPAPCEELIHIVDMRPVTS